MRRSLAAWRWAGMGVIWDATDADDPPGRVTAEAVPQVSLTVVYVQAGAFVSVGGAVTAPATPAAGAVPPLAVTTTETEE